MIFELDSLLGDINFEPILGIGRGYFFRFRSPLTHDNAEKGGLSRAVWSEGQIFFEFPIWSSKGNSRAIDLSADYVFG